MKLRYKGPRARGKQIFPDGGSIHVEVGKVYDIPDKHVDALIAAMCWEKVIAVKDKVEKKKAIFIDDDNYVEVQKNDIKK